MFERALKSFFMAIVRVAVMILALILFPTLICHQILSSLLDAEEVIGSDE